MIKSLIKISLTAIILQPLITLSETRILRVVDGDTIVIEANYLPHSLKPELSLRITGIDTAESNYMAKCVKEQETGLKAKEFTKDFVKEGYGNIVIKDWDKYGGRVLGDVEINGKWLSQELINNNLAKPYNGLRKESWCY